MKIHKTVLFFTNDESVEGMTESLREKIGNILANFVESGKSVIIGTFANGKEGLSLSLSFSLPLSLFLSLSLSLSLCLSLPQY